MMNKFTDEDLARLKEYRKEHPTSLPVGWQEAFDGLLARLECAERCITSDTDDIANYNAWLQSCGREAR